MVIEMLSVACDKDGIEPLCTSSMLAILNAYDRQLTRQEFAETVAAGLGLSNAMSRMDTVLSMQRLSDRGTLDAEKFFEAVKSLTDFAVSEKLRLKEQVKLASQCAKGSDPIS